MRAGQIDIYVSSSLSSQFHKDEKAETVVSSARESKGILDVGVKKKEEDSSAFLGKELLFDTMNTGSAFCAYTFISDEE